MCGELYVKRRCVGGSCMCGRIVCDEKLSVRRSLCVVELHAKRSYVGGVACM